jgi:hypothetical protein
MMPKGVEHKLPSLPEITIKIGCEEIPLQSRSAAIVTLLARHQSAVTSSPTTKIIFDCSPREVVISVQPKLGRVKVGKK